MEVRYRLALLRTVQPESPSPSCRTTARSQDVTTQKGITLIELLVAVAIVGILTAIAYPSYQGQVLKARRTEGQALLLDVAGRQEQYFSNNKTFTTDMTQLGYATDPALSENGYYSVDALAGSTNSIATSYVATAARLGGQTGDTVCFDFTVDSTGHRNMTNYPGYDHDPPEDPPSGCW